MTTLVTGANGFVGSHAVRSLVSRGEGVRALVRKGSDAGRLRGLVGFETVEGDLRDLDSLRAALEGADRVFHCAAKVSDWGPLEEFREATVRGTANIVRAAREARVSRFIHVSTTDVYGYPGYPADETAPYRYRGYPYVDTKIDAEKEAWASYREHGLPLTVLRPASIYGLDSITLVKDIVELLEKGEMVQLGFKPTPAGLCHVDNLVQAMILAAGSEAAIGQAYNVTDGSGIPWNAYVDALADAFGQKRAGVVLPRFVAYPLAFFSEAVSRMAGRQKRPILTRMAVDIFTTTQEFGIEKIKRELGYEPITTFADFLREAAAKGCGATA